MQFSTTGTQGLQGYKDRADDYMCNVLPKGVSPTSKIDVTKGIVRADSWTQTDDLSFSSWFQLKGVRMWS